MNVKRQASGNLQKTIGIIGRNCYPFFGKESVEFMRGKEF